MSSNPSMVQTLVSHLRSSFWQAYQDPDVHRPIPPSLRFAAVQDLEQAIISFCVELQHKGHNSQNPMEWHKAFLSWLQEGGLYKSLSQQSRWKLFSIGQELAVFGRICRLPKWTDQATLQSYDLAEWFLELQSSQMQMGWSHAGLWNQLLAVSLDAATTYREESASPFYDVVSEKPPEALWLSHPSLQKVLLRQLETWRANAQNVEGQHLEAVVKAALKSYSEAYPDKETYFRVKQLAIGLVRTECKDDELAFDLSIQYQYFEGACQIAVDHEKQRDARNYSLDSLFASNPGEDLLTGFTFAQFVLQWHTDKGLYGHAINYGRHSPTDLTWIMQKDERLRKYRWIPAIRQNYWDQATESCLLNGREDRTLATNEWALSMAKLTNKLVAKQNTQRQKEIEDKLELVHAQQLLSLDEENADPKTPLRTPEELVRLAMQKLPEAASMEDRLEVCLIALSVCGAIDDDERGSVRDYTAHVWAECLRLDAAAFTEWLSTETDLTNPILRQNVLQTTVFGALWLECRKDANLNPVTYGRHLESAVIDKIGSAQKLEFSRLLRSVTALEAMKGQSLAVASF